MIGPVRQRINVRVATRQVVASQVTLLELVPNEESPLPKWAPGAHIDLYLPGMVRQYSLCGDPLNLNGYQIAVLRQPDGRGGSAFVHDQLQEGVSLSIGKPRNHFPLVKADEYIFVAGGIGITPLRTMIMACERDGRPWVLHYGGRSRSSLAFLDELESFGDRVRVLPEDEVGLMPVSRIVAQSRPETVIYCCGPEPLLSAMEGVVAAHGSGQLHLERFATPVPKHLPDDVPLRVVCAESDVVVEVGAGETVLDALIAAGVDVNYDCCEGTCGTCELELLDGQADHRDAILSTRQRRESEVFYPCVSRAKSTSLVLDV